MILETILKTPTRKVAAALSCLALAGSVYAGIAGSKDTPIKSQTATPAITQSPARQYDNSRNNYTIDNQQFYTCCNKPFSYDHIIHQDMERAGLIKIEIPQWEKEEENLSF